MSCGRHGCDWISCTLCRSGRQILTTLERASKRSASWPNPSLCAPTLHTPTQHTTVSEAFETMLQCMTSTTQQCKRVYESQHHSTKDDDEHSHFNRFHTIQPSVETRRPKNPLQGAEGVTVEVAPGTYTVSAGAWGSDSQHTHVVHVQDGQMVNLDFNI